MNYELYYQTIKQYKVLTREEEKKLALKAKTGCQRSKDALIKHNLRFVIREAIKYYNKLKIDTPDIINDFISEGNLGLMRAIEKYQPERNIKLISYAVWWIRQAIFQYAYSNKSIRPPLQHMTYMKNYTNAASEQERIDLIKKRYSDSYSPEETAKAVANALKKCGSLDYEFEEGGALHDILSYDIDFLTNINDEKEIINNALNSLSPRERIVIEYTYGLNNKPTASLEKISYLTGTTKEYVRQIKKAALRKLKKSHELKNLIIN